MKVEDSDTEVCFQDEIDEEEQYLESGCKPKLQFRKEVSKARWSNRMRMAEVVERKGRMWTTTGLVRCGKLYCTIEETLFLAEIGALVLLDDDDDDGRVGDHDTCISLEHIYEKINERKNGTYWECFEIYRHMKTLGYILRRHGVPWSVKGVKSDFSPAGLECFIQTNVEKAVESKEVGSLIELFGSMEINGARPVFDVYLPNSKFRKSFPGDPSFIICLTGGYPPSKAAIEALERQCGDVPLKFCHVEYGRVSFFSFDTIELDVLP